MLISITTRHPQAHLAIPDRPAHRVCYLLL